MTAEAGSLAPADLKACCAAAYGSDLVAMLLGPAYHPGGGRLTRVLARGLGLRPGRVVLDAASGPGTTARLLAREFGVDVRGYDLAPALVERARAAARDEGLEDRLSFELGDVERLPVPAASVDAVICECALCTFPDVGRAVGEFARVVRPGGRVAIADVVVERSLPSELDGLLGWIACLAGARPAGELLALLEERGLVVRLMERHDAALVELVRGVGSRLRLLSTLGIGGIASVDLSRARVMAAAAEEAIRAGDIGYLLAVAERPGRGARAA